MRKELPTLQSANSLYFSGETVTGPMCVIVAIYMFIAAS